MIVRDPSPHSQHRPTLLTPYRFNTALECGMPIYGRGSHKQCWGSITKTFTGLPRAAFYKRPPTRELNLSAKHIISTHTTFSAGAKIGTHAPQPPLPPIACKGGTTNLLLTMLPVHGGSRLHQLEERPGQLFEVFIERPRLPNLPGLRDPPHKPKGSVRLTPSLGVCFHCTPHPRPRP